VIVKMIVESRWNVDWQGKPKFSEKTCPSATFVHHKIPHAQVRFRTPDRSGGKPATNRLSYGAAISSPCLESYPSYYTDWGILALSPPPLRLLNVERDLWWCVILAFGSFPTSSAFFLGSASDCGLIYTLQSSVRRWKILIKDDRTSRSND
jgi:hypothetical protein